MLKYSFSAAAIRIKWYLLLNHWNKDCLSDILLRNSFIVSLRFKKTIAMDLENIKNIVTQQDGLSKTLGMEFFSTPDPDTCIAKMKVDERNRQAFGFLSGGASLALAENLAGVGSLAICPNEISVGINVSGSHVKSVVEGETVTAYGRLQHRGRTLHQWHIEIKDSEGNLISTVQVTNYVLRKPRK